MRGFYEVTGFRCREEAETFAYDTEVDGEWEDACCEDPYWEDDEEREEPERCD